MNGTGGVVIAVLNGAGPHATSKDDFSFQFSSNMNQQFDDLYKEIISTPEFERLQGIQQLGVMSKLYPEINHTRYDHSIGVYEEAGKLLEILEQNSSIQINEFHKKCVKLAGLLHDIGHGPYSHFWERVLKDSDNKYVHEEAGAVIVDRIFSKLRLSRDHDEHKYGVDLIQRLITGNKDGFRWRNDIQEEFIFDIINNKTCDIDVDRFDYMKRDWDMCSQEIQVAEADQIRNHLENVKSLFRGAKISLDRKRIQFKTEHLKNADSMFRLRNIFHEQFYQHPKVRVIEDILLNMIRLKRKTCIDSQSFLIITNLREYVEKNISINDEKVEDWLAATDENQNIELSRLWNAFTSFNEFVEISSDKLPNYTEVQINYKNKLKSTLYDCFYPERPSEEDMLPQEYNFNKAVYYRIRD